MARLTTAGALGAAVVHEISQPLATVATYAHACRRLLASEPADLELLDRTMANVESEIRRAGDIVERLRDFLGKSEPQVVFGRSRGDYTQGGQRACRRGSNPQA